MRRLQYLLLRVVTALDWRLRERLTTAGKLTAGTAFGAALLGADTNRTLTYQAFTFLAAALALAMLVSATFRFRFRARVRVQRKLPRHATAGEPLVYRIALENTGARPLADLEVREHFADPRPSYQEFLRARDPGAARRNWFDRKGGYFRWRHALERRLPAQAKGACLALLRPAAREELLAHLVPRRRGVLCFAAVDLLQPDLLGLAYGRVRVPLAERLIVLPRRYRLPQVLLPAQRRLQPGGHALAASVGDSEEFLALREYRPGDSLRRVHWKSFARTGAPVIKEYETEFFERHALVLDTQAEAETEAFEEAVAIAASFVYTIDTQECLLDLVFVAGQPECHTSGRGEASNVHLLEILAGLAPSRREDFASLAHQLLAMRGALSSAILVLLAWDEPRRRLIARLRAAGLGVRVLLVCEPGDDTGTPAAEGELLRLHPGRIEAGLAQLA